MVELLTAAQMRMIENAAIESGSVTGLELMERAGRGVVEAIYEEWPEFAPAGTAERGPAPSFNIERGPAPAPPEYLGKDEEAPRRAVVLCGPGNNGGDGFVVARLLHLGGWAVEVFLYGDAEKLPPDARRNYERWCEIGVVGDLTNEAIDGYAEDNPNTLLAIDALFGTGLTRPFDTLARVQMELNNWEAMSRQKNSNYPRVVAVDVPSGICADSGLYLGVDDNPYDYCAMANLTVTFHTPKLGHFLANGGIGTGRLVVKEIGLSKASDWNSPSWDAVAKLAGAKKVGQVLCELVSPPFSIHLSKFQDDHKYSHGHALILTGGAGKTGAARLAARGALRIGAGLVTLGVPQDAQLEVAHQITALMMRDVETEQDFSEALADTRINALCLGPGLGMKRARALVPMAAKDPARHVVLDADALSAFADDPEALFARLHENCVLTPHGGEFARLFPDIAEKLNARPTTGPAYSKVDATRAAAKRAGCTVMFKGPDTVIASPDGSCAINAALYERAAPWLATAGSGDVLAGYITGLLARGFSPQSAAETAAWLHVECARGFGPGLIAEDLPEELPKVLRQLTADG